MDILKTAKQLGRELTEVEKSRLADLRGRFDEALDAGHGACQLARPEVALMVYNALHFFEGQRYALVAACVMPNHVHAVFAPLPGYGLADILHSWKSFTSNEANKLLGTTGPFWEREYFDHLVRNAAELERIVRYVVENPRKAGLKDWKWAWSRNAGFQPAEGQGRQDAGATPVCFRHLWGNTKRQQLLETAAQDGKTLYEEVSPPLDLGLPFAPTQVTPGYLQWPQLPDLFPKFFAGVQSKRDELVIDVDREPLIERMRKYFDPEISHEEMRHLCPRAMQPTARFEARPVRDYLVKRGFLPQNVVRHCYRPFDLRWIYYEPETRLLGEKSPEYFRHVFEGNMWLVSQQKPRREWSRPQFIRSIGCLDLMDRSASCIPLFLRPIEEKRLLASQNPTDPRILPSGTRLNISDSLVTYLTDAATVDEAPSAFYHALAILHAPTYRTENSGALRQDWPRIPLPDTKESLLSSAALGQDIAALLDTETPFVAPASSRHPDQASKMLALQKIAVFTLPQWTQLKEDEHFAVTAGWGHAGQGGVTMPGKGKIIDRDYTEKERISLGESIKALGERTCDVYLNEFAYWSNVPVRVWEYTIGGYQIIKKWLSYREEELLGRPLTKEEVRYVQEMVRRIAAILLLEPALDENYRRVKEHAYPWLSGFFVPPCARWRLPYPRVATE